MWGINNDSAKFGLIVLQKILGTHFDPFDGYWTLWYPIFIADLSFYSLEMITIR